MSAVAGWRLFRPSLPVIGGNDVAHSFDTDGQPHAGHMELARGARGTWRHGQWRVPDWGNAAATSRTWERRRGLYGCSLSCHRSCNFRRNFVTEAAIPSLALERHTGEERQVYVVVDNDFTLGVMLAV
jgi:hypothetical protein